MSKPRVTLCLSPQLLERIDRDVREERGASRSAVVEVALHRHYATQTDEALRAATVAYYEGQTAEERTDDEAFAKSSGRAMARLFGAEKSRRARKRGQK